MQIFRWHFNSSQHQPKSDHNDIHNKESRGSKDIELYKERRRRRRERRRLRAFTFNLCRKDVATACFYSTLNLKQIGDKLNRNKQDWIYSMKKQQQETTKSSSNHVRNYKVLPVTDNSNNYTTTLTTTSMDKIKGMSRMKDLLRWAASAKSHHNSKSISNFLGTKFRNRAIKGEKEEETRTTCSSGCSSMASSQGNWITTDSEFVVLEL